MQRFDASLLVCVLLLLPLGLLATACSTPSSGSAAEAADTTQPTSAEPPQLPSTPPGPYPDRVVLSHAADPSSSLSVTWRTDSTVTGAKAQVALATGGPSFYTQARTVEAETQDLHDHKVTGEHVSANYHSVTFEGLMADTLYAYRVGDGERWSEWFHARTASQQPEPFSFVYVGDAQNNVRSHWSRLIRQAYTDAPEIDFLLHAGDLVDNAHRNVEWGHWNAAGGFIQSMVPNIAVPGNHEYAGYRTWRARDTFRVEVEANGRQMTGTILEPDGNPEPLEATSSGAAPSSGRSPAGDWDYNVDNGEYVGTLRIESDGSGYGATLVSEDGRARPLQDVSVDGNTLTGHFLMEVEKESPEQLSVHWHPQFAFPENGPDGMEETVYHLDYQGMRVVGLNSEAAKMDEEVLRTQTEWLRSTLREAEQDPGLRWTVVTFHHPMFSSGEGRSNADLRAAWRPILDEYNVDLVLQGHDHTYARGQTKNLKQGVSARSPEGGTVYVNSVSGAKMYEIKPDRWEHFDGVAMERGGENTQLYQVVRVGADTIQFRAYTATGAPYDAFDLVRPGDGGPSRMIERPPAHRPERTHENTLDYTRP
ncbi:fibronectin type III domain-containing protein [Salinibacter ruber]|uniref:fibronectin type III domain-containing protein n=1 Tax=Salinibacter ruber TaxID=146919 RepID=UPI000E57F7D1|nr:fibronectin type III domain-containing protein [Salinibacter ruber]